MYIYMYMYMLHVEADEPAGEAETVPETGRVARVGLVSRGAWTRKRSKFK